MLSTIKKQLWCLLNPFIRHIFILPYYRHRFNNPDVTILSSNCLGGCIAHDLKLRFNSPTVNLWMTPSDFIRFCHDLHHYLHSDLTFIDSTISGVEDYPVARIDDITIYFQHYHTEEEARTKWKQRCWRINANNIRCIMTEKNGCTDEDLAEFSKLPYPTAAIVHKEKKDIPNTHVVRGFEHEEEVGNVIAYLPNHYMGHKYYDDFDYVTFLNR